jgi:hypothetical protein
MYATAATVYNITASISDASGVAATRAYGVMNPSVRVIDCSTHGVPRIVNGTASTTCSCDEYYSGSACAVTCSGHGSVVNGVCKCTVEYRGTVCDIVNAAPVILSQSLGESVILISR